MGLIKGLLEKLAFGDEPEEVGIGGFVAYAKVSGSVERTTVVPGSVLENGVVIADHLINDPIRISIEGVVSQVFTKQSKLLGAIDDVTQELGVVTQYLPERTQAQISKINGVAADVNAAVSKADAIYDDASKVLQAVGLVSGEAAIDHREAFLNTIDAIRESKTLISIETPFRTYDNMALTSIVTSESVGDESVRFQISAEQIRFADTVFVEVKAAPKAAPNPAEKLKGAASDIKDKGVQAVNKIAKPEQSFLSYVGSLF